MKVAFTWFLLVALATVGLAETVKCRVCSKLIEGKYYRLEDKTHGGKVDVCPECGDLETRCFACGLPVKTDFTKLADGRLLCAADAKDAILEDSEAKAVCLHVREDLDRLFARFLSYPQTNVMLSIVDKFTLDSLFKSPGLGQRCSSIFGATRSAEIGERQQVHVISVLSGLSKTRFQAVAAHEFSHAWLNENLRPERRATLAPDAVEAFCEFMAYELMRVQQEEFEKANILENPYTRGQLAVFIAAEQRHGFNTLLEWVKAGETAKLDPDDPDNVRQVNVKTVAAKSSPAPLRDVKRPPPPLPEKLVLQGITGTPARRFAMINDRTFAVADSALIRLAQTNLTVRCLEIRTNSVLVQIAGTGEKQELTLSAPFDPYNTGPYSLKVRVGPLPIERAAPAKSPTQRD